MNLEKTGVIQIGEQGTGLHIVVDGNTIKGFVYVGGTVSEEGGSSKAQWHKGHYVQQKREEPTEWKHTGSTCGTCCAENKCVKFC